MKLRLREDCMLVFCDPDIKKIGNILVPEDHSERTRKATIIAVGPGLRERDGTIRPVGYKVGDRIIMKWHAGDRLHLPTDTINGEPVDEIRHRIIREHEALAAIEEE
jgi:chaperonin GroES